MRIIIKSCENIRLLRLNFPAVSACKKSKSDEDPSKLSTIDVLTSDIDKGIEVQLIEAGRVHVMFTQIGKKI